MISIIIPVYNHQKELQKCLESIKDQTYQDFEVIIVDDGSALSLQERLPTSNFQFSIKLFRINHAGANVARNHGFEQSRGEYLLFCDADIEMKQTMLEEMIGVLEAHHEASYAYSSFKFGWKTFTLWPFDAEKLKKMNYIHTTSLIRRDAFPGFDASIRRFQDWDLWLTMVEQGHTGLWVPEVLFNVKAGGTMSKWLPKGVYGIAQKFSIRLKRVEDYKEAQQGILKKHHLPSP